MKAGQRGFTLIEAMTVVAIIAVLGAIAVVGYRTYVERAAAADLVSAHHNIRNAVQGRGDKTADDCATLAASYDRKLLNDPYARLDYGFEAVPGGFRPVLSVCATAQSGARNIPVAKRAHDSFVNIGVMEKGAVLSDSVVSYALRLTEGELALCKTAPATSGPACAPTQGGTPPAKPAQTPPPAQPAQAPAQPAQPASPPACSADQERVGGNCVAKCPAGSVRDASGNCPAACEDTYGPTCDLDFGAGMCGEDFVQQMCAKFCNLCGPGAAQAADANAAAQAAAAQAAAVKAAAEQAAAAQAAAAQAAAAKAAAEQAAALALVAGSAPGAPRLPRSPDTIDFSNANNHFRTPEQWLSLIGGANPDGSPLRITDFRAAPGFGTPRQLAGGYSGIDFANPGVKAEGWVDITFENAAGRNTVRIPMRTGTGW